MFILTNLLTRSVWQWTRTALCTRFWALYLCLVSLKSQINILQTCLLCGTTLKYRHTILLRKSERISLLQQHPSWITGVRRPMAIRKTRCARDSINTNNFTRSRQNTNYKLGMDAETRRNIVPTLKEFPVMAFIDCFLHAVVRILQWCVHEHL